MRTGEPRLGENDFAGIMAAEGQEARCYLVEPIRGFPLKSKGPARLLIQKAALSKVER
jgi:hypothetical protein